MIMARRSRYTDPRTREIRQAQQERLNEIRPFMDQIMTELAAQTGLPLTMRDGYSGLRYVGKILYNQADPSAIQQMPSQHLFALFRDGIVGAARHRMKQWSSRM